MQEWLQLWGRITPIFFGGGGAGGENIFNYRDAEWVNDSGSTTEREKHEAFG